MEMSLGLGAKALIKFCKYLKTITTTTMSLCNNVHPLL